MGAEDPCAFKPLPKFIHTGLPPNMLHATRAFASPSPIQSQCWPIIQSGRDLIGIASTGSGKTLGFGLPMMAHITKQKVRIWLHVVLLPAVNEGLPNAFSASSLPVLRCRFVQA